MAWNIRETIYNTAAYLAYTFVLRVCMCFASSIEHKLIEIVFASV
jgi:hypothetical protein